MADPGVGEGQGSRGGGLLDRVYHPQEKEGTPQQRQVYEAAREVLKPFEDFYHEQAADFKKGPLPPGVTSNFLKNEYSFKVTTGSGKPVDTKVKTGNLEKKPTMLKLEIGGSEVVFGKDGRIQEIVLVRSALPRVDELRDSLLGPNDGNGSWRNDQLRLSVKKPKEMYLKVVRPEKDYGRKDQLSFVVKEDGTLKEKEKGGYTTTALVATRIVKNPHFPDILKDAMQAIDPANN